MKYPIICISWLPSAGMAIFPFILVKFPHLRNSQSLLTHEHIHLKQQLELLVLPFYVVYLLNYLLNLIRYRNHDRAYRQIIFEREAYNNDHDPGYPARRKWFAWGRF